MSNNSEEIAALTATFCDLILILASYCCNEQSNPPEVSVGVIDGGGAVHATAAASAPHGMSIA